MYPEIKSQDRLVKRFWSKVEIRGVDDCWLWLSGKKENGYGQFWVDELKRSIGAHVVSFHINIGNTPKGMCVCHKCDNPKCVNPNHLFLGTHSDNAKDMIQKGRGKPRRGRLGRLHGENHPRSKLTLAQVVEIRSKYQKGKRGFGIRKLAHDYGVVPYTIVQVVRNLTWQ